MKTELDLVSIITPAYNCEKYISAAIESVLSQTYTNWELLITDDGSTDGTVGQIQKYLSKCPKIKLFRNENNAGAGSARNVSLSHARGRFVAFLDGDDIWMPDKLQKQLAFMNQNQCIISGTSYYIIDAYDKVTGIVMAPSKHTFLQNLCDNKIGLSTCVVDSGKNKMIESPTMRKSQDWGHMMLLLRQHGTAYQIREPLSYYRKTGRSLSSDKKDLFIYHGRMYRDVLNWNMVTSVVFFILLYLPTHFLKMCKVKMDSCLLLNKIR